jgi:histidinol-phosphate/aromatic aminotransferase/cobyric acid decarboxylase-like protein
MIVEYKFHRVKGSNPGRTSVPSFIVDGGYFSEGSKYVGIAANDGTYIPETLVVLDRAALITKLTNIGHRIEQSPENPEGRLATAEEIEATVDSWISEHDI